MQHDFKALIAATDSPNLKKLLESHLKEIKLESNHVTLFVDNAAPLHELNEPRMDKHLKTALEKLFGPGVTYESKLNHVHDKPDHKLFGSPDKKAR